MKVTIDIDEEALVPKVLAQNIQQFEQDLEDYKSGNRFIAIFDTDPKKDKKEIKKHIKAFKTVMKYYSIPGDLIDAATVGEVGVWGEELAVKSYCGGKPNYCTPVDAVNISHGLKECVHEFFTKYLNHVEESDSGKEFNPVTIGCCRALMLEPLNELLERMRVLSGAEPNPLYNEENT